MVFAKLQTLRIKGLQPLLNFGVYAVPFPSPSSTSAKSANGEYMNAETEES